MSIVNSFLNKDKYQLPFDVQTNNHMRESRFPECFDWENYCRDVIFSMGIMIQNVYDIKSTLYKELPNNGFKIVYFIDEGTALVRNVFFTLVQAPRALSKKEFENIAKHKDALDLSTLKWSLKEYTIKDKKISEVRSYWTSEYPSEKGDEIEFQEIEKDQSFKTLFKQNFKSPHEYVKKTTKQFNFCSEYYVYYKSNLPLALTYECAFHHGIQLAFQSITHLIPKAIYIHESEQNNGFFMTFMEQVITPARQPTVFCASKMSSENKKKYAKAFSTKSGFYGKSLFLHSHAHVGSGGVFFEVIKHMFMTDWTNVEQIKDWIIDELNNIWPVNISVPVDEFGIFQNHFYLSRYLLGLLLSISNETLKFKYKTLKFQDYHSNQFLFGETIKKQVLVEVNEYVTPQGHPPCKNESPSNTLTVRINQYVDLQNILRRDVYFIPPNSSENQENFNELDARLDFSHFLEIIDDNNFQNELLDTIKKCFKQIEVFINTKAEMKAFVNGNFHYFESIVINSDTIQKNLGIFKENEITKIVTFNFLTEYEVSKINPLDINLYHKIVNISYKKPFSVAVEDGGLFDIESLYSEKPANKN